jgi:hypothetical protein
VTLSQASNFGRALGGWAFSWISTVQSKFFPMLAETAMQRCAITVIVVTNPILSRRLLSGSGVFRNQYSPLSDRVRDN